MNGFFYTSVVLRRNECGCLHVHGAAVLGTDLFTWDTAPFADGAVLRGLWVAGLFHPLLCSFCGFTALFPKGTVLLQLLFACLFQGVTLFCVFPVVDRQCLVLARQCRKKKLHENESQNLVTIWVSHFCDHFGVTFGNQFGLIWSDHFVLTFGDHFATSIFFSGCCMAQRRSLSGRSPFCQQKLSEESQIHWKSFSAKATNLKLNTNKHQPRCSLPESAGVVGSSLFLGQLDQGTLVP